MPPEQTEGRAAEGNSNVLPELSNLNNLASPPLPRMGTFGGSRTAERHQGGTTPSLNSTTQREAGTTICLLPVHDSVSFVAKQLYLAAGAEMKIGRVSGSRNQRESKPDNGVFLCDVMSREHAMIKEMDGQIWIKDMKSTHGTFVNSTRLGDGSSPSEYYPLNHQDLITFGHSVRRNQNLYKHLSAYVWYPTSEYGQPPPTPIVVPPRETPVQGINAAPMTFQANGFHTAFRQRPIEQDDATPTIRNLLPLTPSNRFESADRITHPARDPKTHQDDSPNVNEMDTDINEDHHLIKLEETSVEKEKPSRTETKVSAKDRVYAPKESHVVKENHTMVKKEGTTSLTKEFDKARENRVSAITKARETTTSRAKDPTPLKPKESPSKHGSSKSREVVPVVPSKITDSITGKSKEIGTSKTRASITPKTRETQLNDVTSSDKNERDTPQEQQDSSALPHDNDDEGGEDENLADNEDKADEEMVVEDKPTEVTRIGKKRSFAQLEEDDSEPTEEQVEELRKRLADAERRSKRIKWEVAASVIGGMIFGATSLAAGAVVFGG